MNNCERLDFIPSIFHHFFPHSLSSVCPVDRALAVGWLFQGSYSVVGKDGDTTAMVAWLWWMCLPHTQHTVNPVATGNKHPLSTEIHPLTEQYTVMAFLPDSPSPLGEMKQEGAAPPSKAPRGHNSLYKFESVHFMQTWTNPPKTNRPPQRAQLHKIIFYI